VSPCFAWATSASSSHSPQRRSSTPGLDEGPVILQKRVTMGPNDTAGSLYFDKIFPLGVSALVEAADLVVSGRATESTQDESLATYEGWVREAESHIGPIMSILSMT
jgi:methionyl-tRNA formyltransferase